MPSGKNGGEADKDLIGAGGGPCKYLWMRIPGLKQGQTARCQSKVNVEQRDSREEGGQVQSSVCAELRVGTTDS